MRDNTQNNDSSAQEELDSASSQPSNKPVSDGFADFALPGIWGKEEMSETTGCVSDHVGEASSSAKDTPEQASQEPEQAKEKPSLHHLEDTSVQQGADTSSDEHTQFDNQDETGFDVFENDEAEASDVSDEAIRPSQTPKRKTPKRKKEKKRRTWHLTLKHVQIALVLLCIAAVVVLATLAWQRWFRYDDSADLQGVWKTSKGEVTIEIDGASIYFPDNLTYDYELNTWAKSMRMEFQGKVGEADYKFIEGRDHLRITDAGEDGLGSIDLFKISSTNSEYTEDLSDAADEGRNTGTDELSDVSADASLDTDTDELF